MRELALIELRDETYLEDTAAGVTIGNIVEEEIMPRFENEYKRSFRYGDRRQVFSYRIRGLRQSPSNQRLLDGEYTLD